MLPILHVDMNAFYASCHQAKDPSLKGKPVMVAGDPKKRNGIILTASYEARRYGVKTAMPKWQAEKLCPQAVFIKPDYDLYLRTSQKVMSILGRFSPQIEIFSIDEAWLDVTGCERLFGDSVAIARKIQAAIAKELDLLCSIGVSCNKLLAKMASDMKKPNAITVLTTEDVPKLLWPLPVNELFGVGRRMAEKLKRMNIKTIGDLAEAPQEFLEKAFGLNGSYLHLWANGIDDSAVNPHSMDDAKSMGHSITLPKDITSFDDAEIVLLFLSEQVGRRVRRENYMGRTVTVTLRYASFDTITRSVTIFYTNSTEDIYNASRKLLYSNWDGKTPLRLLGVSLSNLVKEFDQVSLFDNEDKKRKLNRVMDEIKDRFGDDAIFRAKLLDDKELNERKLKTR
ncbi:DNA polymerase IV [Tepidanaerobacter acetatoxydans Re1]|uniref:DNA polymerase IV n=1 Tax=Tepidanaerobacter acetatoxydans (strain DSM 21804 / JCM 16047 / Re1) TaxID=1209989 RepID=F4LVS4_TEPAE|nr:MULTISPECIES: DNA polymerase IV [Tepidanaerobacter]AEE90771.1 DNA polymerase IV [Tepidanaerobacter acetatoxydans Re1]CCP25326.1 DNA polymerase IV [Tepidanaerobacter acetatoxydans Re1]